MSKNRVKKRAIFMIGGYEPKSADAFYKRTRRELARFGDTWQFETDLSPLKLSQDGNIASTTLVTKGDVWRVETDFNFFVWNKIVLRDFARPWHQRFWRYFVTFWDYGLSGTTFAFFRTSWRFALYFLYPMAMATLLALVAFISAFIIGKYAFPGSYLAISALGLATFFILFLTIGKLYHAIHLMELWSFSRYYLRDKRPFMEDLVDRFANAVVDELRKTEYDEVLLIGHSTGGAIILDIAATALAKNPEFAAGKAQISLLTVGSTALKIGLHPAAKKFRAKVQTLVDNPSINWVEYQSRTDIVNFYKTDPVKEMNLTHSRKGEYPIIRRVRMRDTLLPKTYRRVKRNFFRVHYQFIMANTLPCHYDFFMICCGPLTLPYRARNRIVEATGNLQKDAE